MDDSSAFSDSSVQQFLNTTSEAKRLENRRYRGKKKQLKRSEVEMVLLPLQSRITGYRTPYEGTLAQVRDHCNAAAPPQSTAAFDLRWDLLPPSLNMHYGDQGNKKKKYGPAKLAKNEAREQRKRRQCEAFAGAIYALNLPAGSVLVDFGSGSCGLTLPLAYFFPHLHFVAVDLKEKALSLMRARATEAGLKNVRTVRSSILHFEERFDMALALHACGQASDDAILKAVEMRVPYLVSPCCLGKVKFSCTDKSDPNRKRGCMAFIGKDLHGGEFGAELIYPRSEWLQDHMTDIKSGDESVDIKSIYCNMAASADSSQMLGESHEMNDVTTGQITTYEYHRMCCDLMCLDRNLFAVECGDYKTNLMTIPGLQTSSKSDLLLGYGCKPALP
jgi:hypothetical protein